MMNKIKNLDTPYIYQVELKDTPVANRFSECGPASACMFCAEQFPLLATIAAVDMFNDDFEPGYGQPGEGENIVKADPTMHGQRLGAYVQNYVPMINKWVHKYAPVAPGSKAVLLKGKDANWDEYVAAIDRGSAVMFATEYYDKNGKRFIGADGKPQVRGHFRTGIGYVLDDQGKLITVTTHDPAGDERRGYFNKFGAACDYDITFMDKRTSGSVFGLQMIMWM